MPAGANSPRCCAALALRASNTSSAPKFANQTPCLAAGGCSDHTSAATFGELHSERAHRAGCSLNQQRVAGTQAQLIVDPLQRR